jgi:3-oxoacyl-(acyl-carrier-protein) synthase/NAD(P)-dependent dehydrogenase (short-subunit alcohol dehydrogenase family)
LLGHSFGEIAALAVGGAYTFETGVKIVCQRVLSLAPLNGVGQMGALSCGLAPATKLLDSLGRETLQIAVLNHDRQTVISGDPAELAALGTAAAAQGVSLTILKSRFPFHSSLLFPAVTPFRTTLCSYNFAPATIPVYLGTENRIYGSDSDLADVLAAQFIRKLDFAGILKMLSESGYRHFIESGAGDIVTGITNKALNGATGLICLASAHPNTGVAKGVAVIIEQFQTASDSRGPIEKSNLATLLQDVQGVLERTAGVLGKVPAPAQPAALALTPEPEPSSIAENLLTEPIAIVAMGCVLPGARDPEQYWHNLTHGVSGIVDLARDDDSIAQDFRSGDGTGEVKIVSDKTYTLLHGSVGTIQYDARLLSGTMDQAKFQSLSRAEKLLALATAQSLDGIHAGLAKVPQHRMQFILGATGDGCGEYDEALFLDNVEERLTAAEPDASKRRNFSTLLRECWTTESAGQPPTSRYQHIVQSLLGHSLRMYVVDAACSSSLYAVNLGMKALQNHSVDVVFAGGVFAPGPANNTLFAQFRGLTPTASRPLDAAADGVVFGDGAGVLVLKRLTDAVANQDRIVGVIRGMGVSSDGKSPAINVPQKKGQSLAIRRAYERSGIDANTIQYVEAHATGTPVGDAVEFQALRDALPRAAGMPQVELGSVKSLIGHTGWAAGVASVIKLIKSFEARTVPPQHNFKATGPEIALADSPFTIATSPRPWPKNSGSLPMRAAINGFGFGGTNAHLLLESYDAAYHKTLCGRIATRTPAKLAVISTAAMFPAGEQLAASAPGGEAAFHRKFLSLPKGKMLLPDVREHMDASQYLAALGAEQILGSISDKWPAMRSEIGVVLGVEAKTERGMRANQRIFLDRLKRRVADAAAKNGKGLTAPDATRIVERLEQAIQTDVIPSGPYTLPGLMPNVVAGRVAHMFDLNGPNIVLDMGANSLFQCVAAAADFLEHKECKIVLTGGINAARTAGDQKEGAFLLALTTVETAKEFSLPIECLVTLSSTAADALTLSAEYRGASGITELAQAMTAARAGQTAIVSGEAVTIQFGEGTPAPPAKAPAPVVPKKEVAAPSAQSAPYAYVQGTPIHYFTPVLVPADAPAAAAETPLRTRKILFLTDQPERWLNFELSGALAGLHYQVLCTRNAGLSRAIEVNLESDEKLAATLQRLAGSFDAIVPILSLEDSTASSLLAAAAARTPAVLDLLFAACRQSYTAIEEGQVWVASLCLNAFRGQNLDPHTGLTAGFLKALARELPNSVCRIVNTDETNLHAALRQVEAELARETTQESSGAEICYRGGRRHTVALLPVGELAQGDRPVLTSDSVVLATGGGRGVTAVLAEELLTRFGCTVIALGRTDPSAAPANMLAMDEAQLAAYEPQFYKERLAQGGKKITELKKEYWRYQASHEVAQTIRQLSALRGRFEYIATDLTDAHAVTTVMDAVYRKYGRVDMVLHGAGTQVSKVLPKKSLRDFQGVVAAKLESLRLIYQACHRHAPGKPVDYHILTSAFSYMGNDGQEDYGAANETLNRLAAVMTSPTQNNQWMSVAWLGWAGIGMTRGSEYAALAASRKLRGVTKEEGQKIFAELLQGRATAPINILLAAGEMDFYKVKTAPIAVAAAAGAQFTAPPPPAPVTRKSSLLVERTVSSETAPYVWDHLVDGIPTLPGAFLIMLIAETALELRPGMKVTAFEDAAFKRFVRMRREGSTPLRFQAQVLSEDDRSTLIRVAILADFVHKNGTILQRDVEQTVISVRLAASVAAPPQKISLSEVRGQLLEDPYLMEGSPVHLNGPFKAMKNITSNDAQRHAEYKLRDGVAAARSGYQYLLPNLILMDALWRFGAIHRDQDTFPIYVPEACKLMKVYYDFGNPDEKLLTGKLTFSGANPHLDADRLMIGPVEAKDPTGATLLLVDGGLCRKLGEARYAK